MTVEKKLMGISDKLDRLLSAARQAVKTEKTIYQSVAVLTFTFIDFSKITVRIYK